MTNKHYQAAIAAFDQANSQDPNKEMADGREYPKELLYAQRMSDMQERYLPDASEAVKLASGSYSRVFTMHTERGETYEIIVYAKTASMLFPVPETEE